PEEEKSWGCWGEWRIVRGVHARLRRAMDGRKGACAENPGPGAGVPPQVPHARASDRAIESLLRHSRQTAAPRFMQRRACAQVEGRFSYVFFLGSAAGVGLRVSGVSSTSVAGVMYPASDGPPGLA